MRYTAFVPKRYRTTTLLYLLWLNWLWLHSLWLHSP